MDKVKEITIWASGVVQDKEARDAALCLSSAATRDGKFTQAFDNYVDLPDRVYVPLRKYARISETEIEEKYQYENEHPEIVLVMEPTIIKGMNVLHGMKQGGTLVVNTNKNPAEILKFLPNKSLLKRIACVDATKINPQSLIDFTGSEGGVDKAGIGHGIGAVMAGAVAKATGCVKLENLVQTVGNPEATRRGFAEVIIMDL